MFDRFLKNYTLEERSWIKYDIANSAYTLTFVTVFFPIIFKLVAAQSDVDSENAATILLKATGWYSLIIAILSPILGNISDYKGYKKILFKIFLFMGLIFGLLLCIPVVPWQIYLGIYIIATIGYTGANIFYDAFLTDVTEEENYNKVSSNGFAWGYIGSCVPFILGLGIYALVNFEIVDMDPRYAIALAFLISIIWWGYYSFPMLKNVNQKYYVEKPAKWFISGLINTGKTFLVLCRDKKVLFFLIGYFFYIDAVGTIIKSAVNIGEELGVTNDITLVMIVLLVQFIAFPCAILFSILAKKIGQVSMLTVGVLIYILICTVGYFISSQIHLFIFAGLVGLAQGGIQAVSRSHFGSLIPKERSGDYFGFFNIFGKFAAIMGPFILGYTIDISIENGYDGPQAVRFGILSLIPLLVIGLAFLLLSTKMHSNKEALIHLDVNEDV